MATTAEQILVSVAASLTTLYTKPASGVNQSQLVFINFCNTNASDRTLDLVHEDAAGTTTKYILDDITVPGKGVYQWSGLFTFEEASSKIRAIASATGIDATGTALEIS